MQLGFKRSLKIKRLKYALQTKVRGEAQFLAGPNTRAREFWRVIKIAYEFIKGFRALAWMGPAVTVFGSARFKEDTPEYGLARRIGRELATEGFTVMTGGGPGIMEAANRGARDVGGPSVGCNIILPHEQEANPYVDYVVTFYYFFVRKVMLVKYSYAFVIMPGGLGTLDEMSEALTLIQTGKVYDFPVILVGKDYWQGFLAWIRDTLVARGAVSPEDLDILHLTDDPAEVTAIIRKATQGLSLNLRPLQPFVE